MIVHCTCSGVLCAARLVNPTMSLKKMVTLAKLSAVTALPTFRSSTMDLLESRILHMETVINSRSASLIRESRYQFY